MNARLNGPWHSQNPLMQIAAFVLAMLVLIVGLVMGAIVFFVLLGFAAVFAVIFWLRFLWIRHKLRKAGAGGFGAAGPGPFAGPFGRGGPRAEPGSGRVIEVEYTVVGDEGQDQDQDQDQDHDHDQDQDQDQDQDHDQDQDQDEGSQSGDRGGQG